MDGRKVQHVEAHVGQVSQPRLDVPESAVPPGLGAGRTGKHFVPPAEYRALAVRYQFERHRRGEAAVRIPRNNVCARSLECHRLLCGGIGGGVLGCVAQLRRPFGEDRAVAALGPNGGIVDERDADAQRHPDIGRIFSSFELPAPRFEMIYPRHHRVSIAAGAWRGELGNPHVIRQRLHVDFVFVVPADQLPAQHDAQLVVTIGKAMRFDLDGFARDALDREAAAVDHGQDRVDHCTHPTLCNRLRCAHLLARALRLSHAVRNAKRWWPAAAA